VIGHINWKAKEEMERGKSAKLRHRIHQWSISTLAKLLEENPVHMLKRLRRALRQPTHLLDQRLNPTHPW